MAGRGRPAGTKNKQKSKSRSKSKSVSRVQHKRSDIPLAPMKRVLKTSGVSRTSKDSAQALSELTKGFLVGLGQKAAAAKAATKSRKTVDKDMLAALCPEYSDVIRAAGKSSAKDSELATASTVAAFRKGLGDGEITADAKYALNCLAQEYVTREARNAALVTNASKRITARASDVSASARMC